MDFIIFFKKLKSRLVGSRTTQSHTFAIASNNNYIVPKYYLNLFTPPLLLTTFNLSQDLYPETGKAKSTSVTKCFFAHHVAYCCSISLWNNNPHFFPQGK